MSHWTSYLESFTQVEAFSTVKYSGQLPSFETHVMNVHKD